MAQSNQNGVPITPATASADDLSDCAQMLDQSIEEVRALKKVLAAQEKLNVLNDAIIEKKDAVIAEQEKQIAIYEKRKGTRISFLFGLIKITKN